jgi:hypothetical protein
MKYSRNNNWRRIKIKSEIVSVNSSHSFKRPDFLKSAMVTGWSTGPGFGWIRNVQIIKRHSIVPAR